MVKVVISKQLVQCENCHRSGFELPKGSSLLKCSACQMAHYCSKECQKEQWPLHKAYCKFNAKTRAALGDQYKKMAKLKAFSMKHRRSFKSLGIYAFDLHLDITRCMREVLYIRVNPNPDWDGKEAETAFLASEIKLVPLELFFEKEEYRRQLGAFHDEQRKRGRESGFMVFLSDVSSGMASTCTVGFEKDAWQDMEMRQLWKERLMLVMNAGIAL